MMKKKQYIQVSLITGQTYTGYVEEYFEPNLEEEISFTLNNVHYTTSKANGKPGDAAAIDIREAPKGMLPQIDIMWHAVAAIQYLVDDSSLVKKLEKKDKNYKQKTKKKKANLVLLKKETKRK